MGDDGQLNRNVGSISPRQLRMALAALDWGWRDVEAATKISRNTLHRFLAGEQLRPSTLTRLQQALEAAGVQFIPENGGGPGVRLRKPQEGGE